MSGNIFKTKNAEGLIEYLTGPIQQQNVEQTFSAFADDVLIPLGIQYSTIGSAGKKQQSGDIDIAVLLPDYPPDKEKRKEYNHQISQDIVELLDPQYFSLTGKQIIPVKLMGTNIHVRYPIVQDGRKTDAYIQVDLMPSQNPKNTSWLMWGGTEEQVTGKYRVLLLNFIAKKRSQELSQQTGRPIKVALATPGGIEIRDPQGGGSESLSLARTNDPQEILRVLEIDAAPGDVVDYESLVEVLKSDSKHSSSLCEFSDYISPHLTRDSVNAKKAIACIGENFVEVVRPNSRSLKRSLSPRKLREFIRGVLREARGSSSNRGLDFAKVPWPDKLKLFPSAYSNKTSASATEGKDEEGAEKAVALSENLIYLAQNGYLVTRQDALIIIESADARITIPRDEALSYLLGYENYEDLPPVKIEHVPGLEKYDLRIIDGKIPMEVKKMGSPTVLSKLGSSTSRNFENNVNFISPLRRAGNITKEFLEKKNLVDESGKASVRTIANPPAAFKINEIAEAVELLNYLFFGIQYSRSKKELRGLISKVSSGQLPAGMINAIRKKELFEVDGKNILDVCKKTLDNVLGEYSPVTPPKSKEAEEDIMSRDSVDVTAMLGKGGKKEKNYSGKVSLDYFFSDLIFRLYDNEADEVQLEADSLAVYTESIEFLATIYSDLSELNEMQGENVFDQFIESLLYAGFYGVMPNYYYIIPNTSNKLELYSTTQGFRALLKLKEIPGNVVKLPNVKISKSENPETIEISEEMPEEESDAEEIDLKFVT